MKISQKLILTNFENCNDNLWTPCKSFCSKPSFKMCTFESLLIPKKQ